MRRAFVLVLGVAVAAAIGASMQRGKSSVEAEIKRLERTLDEIDPADLPEDTRGLIEANRRSLERVKGAPIAEYRLYRLRDPYVGIETLDFLASHKEARVSVGAFEDLWKKHQKDGGAVAADAHAVLHRGLIESATSRSERLFDASLPYARAALPWSGVYYLGESQANRRFAEFVAALGEDRPQEAGAARARLTAILDRLEGEMLEDFGADITSSGPIAVSVRIKEARELLAAGRLDGAALLAAEARVALLRRGGKPASWDAAPEPPPSSLTSLFAAWAADEEGPLADQIRDDVIPLVASMGAPAQLADGGRPPVTVTLVRWPYT